MGSIAFLMSHFKLRLNLFKLLRSNVLEGIIKEIVLYGGIKRKVTGDEEGGHSLKKLVPHSF